MTTGGEGEDGEESRESVSRMGRDRRLGRRDVAEPRPRLLREVVDDEFVTNDLEDRETNSEIDDLRFASRKSESKVLIGTGVSTGVDESCWDLELFFESSLDGNDGGVGRVEFSSSSVHPPRLASALLVS